MTIIDYHWISININDIFEILLLALNVSVLQKNNLWACLRHCWCPILRRALPTANSDKAPKYPKIKVSNRGVTPYGPIKILSPVFSIRNWPKPPLIHSDPLKPHDHFGSCRPSSLAVQLSRPERPPALKLRLQSNHQHVLMDHVYHKIPQTSKTSNNIK